MRVLVACLWLKWLTPLNPTRIVAPRLVCCNEVIEGICPTCLGKNKPKQRWGNQTNSGQNKLPPSEDRWKLRSETYQGIADAMAAQWGSIE